MADYIDDPTLVDPDIEGEARYNWDEQFQRHILSMILTDRQFVLQSIDLVNPGYFKNRAHQTVCSIVFDFFRKYRILPNKDFVVQEMKDRLKDNKSLSFYLGEVHVLFDYFQPGLEAREYLMDKITYFAKIMAVKKAFSTSIELMGKEPEGEETWSKIYNTMRQAMLVDSNYDMGTDYFKSIKDRYQALDEEYDMNARFITNFPSVDNEIDGGGYSPGEILAVVAASGVGKSVYLANFAADNLLRGKRGCYISCELKESKVCQRVDAIMSGMNIKTLRDDREDLFKKIESFHDRLADPTEDGLWPLIVKEFPAGSATVNTLRAYLSQLAFNGFKPDFVIVDYVGEMRDYPGMKIHDSRKQIMTELRGMGQEENFFTITALQPNRSGKTAQKEDHGKLDDDHLADSFLQIAPLDGALSFMQNDVEKDLGVGRGYVMKQRDGSSRFMFYLQFDKLNLRIREISLDTYKSIRADHRDKVVQEVDIDNIRDMQSQAEDAGNNAREAMKKKLKGREKSEN